jgi:hypothetical protein
MHGLFRSCLTFVLIATLTGLPVLAAPASSISTPLGVVLQADQSRGKVDRTSNGATIYDGDRLETADGTLNVRLGGSQMYLRANTAAQVHSLTNGFSADLNAGTVVVSAAEGQTFQLLANDVTIRPVGTQGAVAQITRVNSKELLLSSTRGRLAVSVDNEVETIEAGSSYRVEIDAGDAGPQGTGSVHAGHHRHLVFYLIAGGVAVATGILIWRALMSPSGL